MRFRSVSRALGILSLCVVLTAMADADELLLVLGSFANKTRADRFLEEKRAGLDGDVNLDVRAFETDDRTLYRIVAGPFDDRQAADDFKKRGFEDAWVWVVKPGDMNPVARTAPTRRPARDESSEDAGGPPAGGPGEPSAGEPGAVHKLAAPVAEYMPAPRQDERPDIPETTLVETVKLALERNLGLQASTKEVASVRADVAKARAGLRPNISGNVRQTTIDKDRAEVSFGRAPQYLTTAGIDVRQPLFSDRTLAGIQIQEMLQKARESDREKAALDTVLNATVSFLKLLRTRAQARIVADDLQLTRSNYERAKTRLELGVANKSEVYRWQTRLASSRQQLNLANAQVQRAQVDLNQVVNRPLEAPFNPQAPDLEQGALLFATEDVWHAIQDRERQSKLKDYWISEALLFAPELETIRNQRAAQYRRLLAAKRKIRIPEIVLSVDATKQVGRKGEGVQSLQFDVPGSGSVSFDTDNVEWSAAITASLPLYGGGGNRAEIRQAGTDSERMDILYDQALQAIQSGVLKNVASFDATLNNIELARQEADAAKSNLDLVKTSYDRGAVTIIDLLDAQVAAVSAERSAANAVYDFLIAYMRLQRTVGRFDVALTPDERASARERLKPYLE